jgi:hypothetical protein
MRMSNIKLRPRILVVVLLVRLLVAKLAVIPAGIPNTPAPMIVLIKLMMCATGSTVPSGGSNALDEEEEKEEEGGDEEEESWDCGCFIS